MSKAALRVVSVACLAVFVGGSVQAQATLPSAASQPASQPVVDISPFFAPPVEFQGRLGEFRPLLKFDDGRPVRTAADWYQRRQEILRYWHRRMGPWPQLLDKPALRYLASEHVDNHTRHKVNVEVAPRVYRDAYLLVPDGQGPFPAVLVVYYDARTGAGVIRKRGALLRAFGYDLARRGFVALCVGDPGVLRSADSPVDADMQPISYLAYCAANCANLLANLPEVDAERIGVVGHSFGGKWALMASCLYERFACACWSDAGVVWDEQEPNTNWWEPWYLGFDPDHKRAKGVITSDNPRTGAYRQLVEQGHDLHELHALMAPRPFLVSGGAFDPPRQWIALNHTIAVNDLLGCKDRVAMTSRSSHEPTAESNEQMYRFFERFLKHPGAASQPAPR